MIASRPLGFLGSSFFDPHTGPGTRRSLFLAASIRLNHRLLSTDKLPGEFAFRHIHADRPPGQIGMFVFRDARDSAAGQTALAAEILN
jgi:hypothetical protein